MNNNYFKTIIMLSLCIGISLPTNAAVSVSDGSAFVTKAEFAADLNNLSNRMAQLENSLDAKIDSLVSSYLTRNGIWNAKRQILTKNSILDFWYDFTEAGISYDFSGLFKNNAFTPGESMYYRDKTWDFIEECDKSGLLVGQYTVYNGYDYVKSFFESSSGTDSRHYVWFNSNASTDSPVATDLSSISFLIDDIDLFSRDQVFQGQIRNRYDSGGVFTGSYLYIIPNPGVVNVSFFVNKGDKIKLRYLIGVSPNTNDCNAAFKNKTAQTVGSYCGIGVKFNDFSIY